MSIMTISQEKRAIIDAIAEGRNVFITGVAGTGKSYTLNLIREQFEDKGLHITASTGIAAVQIGGKTLHSWAGLGTGAAPLEEILASLFSGRGSRLRRKLKNAKMLAIDEISMISGELFDMLNEILKQVRGRQAPFGGLQLILVGDFLQLPPVSRTERQFCFESQAWQEANPQIFMLQEVFRQEDERFIDLLNHIRSGSLSEAHLQLLEERRNLPITDEIRPTVLCTHNYQAEEINSRQMATLTGKGKKYVMKGSGDENSLAFLRRNCLAAEELVLKAGAQVMMLKNTFYKEGISNGSLGIVEDFTDKGFPVVRFTNGKKIAIDPDEWLAEEYNSEERVMVVKASVRQIPLLPAWAITVHKSQGMTLERVECDLGSAFEEGQVYVALSRVKSLDGLYLKHFRPELIKANAKVVDFYEKLYADASNDYLSIT
jgi:ATP-dependent DNA helicase PIF1